MDNFKIGVIVDSFGTGFKDGVKKAVQVKAEGIQMYAVSGEMSPQELTPSKIAEVRQYIKDNGLKISALCGDLGGYGFSREEENAEKVEKSKRIVDLALELGTNIVTTHIGVIPADKQSKTRDIMAGAVASLGEYAKKSNAWFAIETGPEPAAVLNGFLKDLGTGGVGVNFDPANLAMVTGDDPVKAVLTLKDYIVHTHAKDGVMYKQTDPQIIYDFFAVGGIGDLRLDDYFKEVPLGQGQVDFDNYLSALKSIGYKGYLTIEREVGDNPMEDIAMAVGFLNEKISCL